MRYLTAWRLARYGEALRWPETTEVAATFILDHAEDLSNAAPDDPARRAAEAMIAAGVRRELDAPSPATLNRRISAWRTLHRRQGEESPFADPRVAELLRTARRASGVKQKPHSRNPITAEVLETLIAALPRDIRGLRDGALFAFAFATGGRRASELSALRFEMLDLTRFAGEGIIPFHLATTKTTEAEDTPPLATRGRAAVLLHAWLEEAQVATGPVFRAISRHGVVTAAGISPRQIANILRGRLVEAGYEPDYASPHGFRSGFMTEAGKRGKHIGDAMALSLHRSPRQAMKYYRAGSVERNEAGDLF